MGAIQYPLVNGVRHGFSSIELKIGGDIYIGFKSINYNRTRTRGTPRGNHPDPLGKTRGTNEYKADIEMLLAEYNAMITKLGNGYGDVLFPVYVTYGETNFDTITDELIGCSIDTTDASNSESPDPLYRKFELNPVKVKFAGLDDLATPLRGVGG